MLYIKLYLGGIHNLPDRSGNPKILNTLLIFFTGLISFRPTSYTYMYYYIYPILYGELHTEEQ